MFSRNGIEYKVKTASVFFHLGRIVGNDNFISSKMNRIILFILRSGKYNDVSAKCMSKLHRHVSKPTKTNSPTFLPVVTLQCSIGEYVVIPAHSSGATPARLRLVGTCRTKWSLTTMLSEYPP